MTPVNFTGKGLLFDGVPVSSVTSCSTLSSKNFIGVDVTIELPVASTFCDFCLHILNVSDVLGATDIFEASSIVLAVTCNTLDSLVSKAPEVKLIISPLIAACPVALIIVTVEEASTASAPIIWVAVCAITSFANCLSLNG